MKKVAIFDEYYETSDALEKEVNDWIEQYKVKVISIDVKNYSYGDSKRDGGIEHDFFLVCNSCI